MSACRSAAYLMDQWLGAHCCDVLVSSSGQRFQGEGERIEAFRVALAAARSDCGVQVLDAGQGLHAPTVAAVGRLLTRQPWIAAVYSVGGANAAIRAAFEQAGRSQALAGTPRQALAGTPSQTTAAHDTTDKGRN
ncbi:hypothetical protein ET532_028705 [Verminephrobacter sp. Larva24]|nr:hypothetical protein ET532_028705 [Verminephrobacter sp. Larva24]